MYNRHAIAATAIGELTLVAADDALIGIYYPQHWVKPERATLGDEVPLDGDALLSEVVRQLEEYFAGARTVFEIPSATRATTFRNGSGRCCGRSRSAKPPPTGNWRSSSATNRWRGWSAGRWATTRCPSSCRATAWSARTAS